MTRTKLIAASFLLLAAAIVWIAAAPANSARNSGFGTDVQIEPSSKSQNGFSVRVKVTELATGAVVVAPHLLVPAGENGEAKSDLPDGSSATVAVRVDAAGHTASYSVAIKNGDQILASHMAKVNLQ